MVSIKQIYDVKSISFNLSNVLFKINTYIRNFILHVAMLSYVFSTNTDI